MAPISPLLFPFLSLFLSLSVRAEMNSSITQPSDPTNTSTQLFLNTSSTSAPAFPYIIPYSQTQDCNIYGPLCQPGSITVGVNLTTATTSIVLPCSSYLSAQSAHFAYENNPNDPRPGAFWENAPDGSDLWTWDVKFGQSPECRSYVAIDRGQSIFSGCDSSNMIIQTAGGLDTQIPPGVSRYFSPIYQGSCCGNCSLDIPEVRLYYFSDKTTDCQHNVTSNVTSTLPDQKLEKRIYSLVANGSTAVINGHTFTSPSLYLQLLGTATVHDRCTTVGPKLINPIITLALGELSTWKPPVDPFYEQYSNFTVGEIWSDPSGIPDTDEEFAAGFALLNVNDLASPTWGLGMSTSADGTVVTTIGPPWLPLIRPPKDIFSLDPIWAAGCTGLFTDSFGLTTLALFDPPIALTPAVLLPPTPVPTPAAPTTTPGRATPSASPAKPASLPNDPVAPPARTEESGRASPTQSPVIASVDPASLPNSSTASPDNEADPPSDPPTNSKVPSSSAFLEDSPADPIAPSYSTLDPPSLQKSPSNPKVPPFSAIPQDPPADPITPSSNLALDPPSGDSQKSPSNTEVPNPVPLHGEDTQRQTQGLGALIYNAFGRLGPDGDGITSVVNTLSLPTQPIFTIGAQTFTANPIGFKINNAAIAPGGTGYIIDGTTISLDQSGVLAIGSSTISLTTPPAAPVLAVAGHTITPNPSAFSIAGSIISAGGPAVVIGGTTIRLDQPGALAVGSTTISLTNPSPTPVATKAFTVAGQAFTPDPSTFSIAGTTISANGPAVTISGTVISLGQSGALAIGSSTIDLTTSAYTLSNKVYTVAGLTFTPNPSAFSIAGTTISANGPAVTIGGTIISLGQSGALAIGSSTTSLPTPSDPSPNRVYTVAGQTFTPNPSAFSIAGTTISAGSPAVTVDGTIISLQPSGTLLLGSSTIQLSATPQATFSSSDVDIDGLGVKALESSSLVVVDGVTLSAAAAGVTVSGTVLSLEAGGATLDIGTSRFAVPTRPPGGSAANGSSIDTVEPFTGAGQGKGDGLGLSLLLLIVGGVCGTLFRLLMI